MYYEPGHHDVIITHAVEYCPVHPEQSCFRLAGGYLPMAVIDHGALTGFISTQLVIVCSHGLCCYTPGTEDRW